MKLGVNPWTVYGWELPDAVGGEFVASLSGSGCQGVELILDENHNSEEALLRIRDELVGLLRDNDLEVPSVASALFWRYNLASQDGQIRQRGLETVRAGCRVASAYGARVFLVVAGVQEVGVEYARTYDTAVQSLQQVASYAAEMGIVLGVENVPANLLCSPGEYAQYLSDVNEPAVQAYLDFGNGASIGNGFSENWITAVRGRIALVHAKDYDQGFKAFVCCGQGDTNWQNVFSALRDVAYDDYLIVETPPKGGRGEPDFAAGLQAAQTSLAWLRRFI